jgi:hypothetical protein
MTINGRWNMWNAGISAGRFLTGNNWELVDDKRIARCSMTINGHSSTSSTVTAVDCTFRVLELAVICSFWMGLSFPIPE